MNKVSFGKKLELWLKGNEPKTLNSLISVFDEKSFAVAFIFLLFIPALPLPTGGITHIFEIVAMLLAIEMILGRKTIWLPKRWQNLNISSLTKALPKILNKINWIEKHSKPHLKGLLKNSLLIRLTGFILFIFCLSAFLAPPFSGLDTLPSLAVVLLGLSLIFEDIYIYISGILVGIIGIGLVISLGVALFNSFKWF
ncbi:MAG TPA: exopolysaccharide biosynthesis protein [Patescibacteria group bacterium]|nr:exopolysaccharide biosynthesis protein [Patescibacteria group bacterium]